MFGQKCGGVAVITWQVIGSGFDASLSGRERGGIRCSVDDVCAIRGTRSMAGHGSSSTQERVEGV